MSAPTRSDVSPTTLTVDLVEEGVVVEYADGRNTLYRDPPEPVEGSLSSAPGKQVHVLVTDPTGTEGVVMYVNDFDTHDEILRDTGVGRVILEPGEREELFPGVTVRSTGERITVEADPAIAGGRVFVFVEDDWGERSFEIVGDSEGDGNGESEGDGEGKLGEEAEADRSDDE